MTSPVSTLGQDTFNSSAATCGREANACTSSATSSPLKPMTLTIRGTDSSASWGRSSARYLESPLFGRPIELSSPAGSSQRRGGGLP